MDNSNQQFNQQQLKQQVAQQALEYVLANSQPNDVLGIGTGSTTNCFIELLGSHANKFRCCVSSSIESERRLIKQGIHVATLTEFEHIAFYVDGADEINPNKQLIKGGGGALTREKIVASASREFICIADASKQVDVLGKFPLPIEYIDMAETQILNYVKLLGAHAVKRAGFVSDNGHLIMDVHGLEMNDPIIMEQQLNQLPGVVCNGLFALRPADVIMIK